MLRSNRRMPVIIYNEFLCTSGCVAGNLIVIICRWKYTHTMYLYKNKYIRVYTHVQYTYIFIHMDITRDAGTIFGKVKYAHIGRSYYTYFACASVKVWFTGSVRGYIVAYTHTNKFQAHLNFIFLLRCFQFKTVGYDVPSIQL